MPFFDHGIALVFMLVFYGALIVLAVWLVLWAIRIAPRRVRPDNARAVLLRH